MLKKTIVFATFVGFAFTVNPPAPAYALNLCISHKHTGTGRSATKRTAKYLARQKWRAEVLIHRHPGKHFWSQAKNKSSKCSRKYGVYKCRVQAIPCLPSPKLPGSSSGKPKETAYKRLRNVLWHCLDVAGGVNANGTNVQIFTCNGSRAQQWGFSRGRRNISISSNTGGRCLDVAGGVNANRTNVQLFDCNGSKSQQWAYTKRKEIRNAMGRCLDVATGVSANQRNVQIFDCNRTKSQQWTR
jgi:hypothetical protein